MPRVTLRLAESAVADLEAIGRWYAEQGVPGIGERFIGEILEKIEALQDHPRMGRAVPEFDQPALRELIHPPFRIVYRYTLRRVQIVRVWRSERPLELPRMTT